MENLKAKAIVIDELIRLSECDARAEVILMELLGTGLSMDNFIIYPEGTLNRPFKRDISSVRLHETQTNKLNIVTSREGLFDYLPKGLFFPILDNTLRSRASDMTQNVRRNNIIEANARKFFAPFDTIFGLARLEAEQHGRALSDAAGEGNFGPLGIIWELPDEMDLREKGLLIMLLPFSREISSNPKLLSGLYSMFFNMTFSVSAPEYFSSTDQVECDSLGDCHLGYSSILSGSIESIHTKVEVCYRIESETDLVKFEPGARNDRMLDFLNGLFLQADAEVEKKHDLSMLSNDLVLEDGGHVILGYSAYLEGNTFENQSITENVS